MVFSISLAKPTKKQESQNVQSRKVQHDQMLRRKMLGRPDKTKTLDSFDPNKTRLATTSRVANTQGSSLIGFEFMRQKL